MRKKIFLSTGIGASANSLISSVLISFPLLASITIIFPSTLESRILELANVGPLYIAIFLSENKEFSLI